MLQILHQLALQLSYWNLVSLGIAGVDGVPINYFRTSDTQSMASSKERQHSDIDFKCSSELISRSSLLAWLTTPIGRKKRSILDNSSMEN